MDTVALCLGYIIIYGLVGLLVLFLFLACFLVIYYIIGRLTCPDVLSQVVCKKCGKITELDYSNEEKFDLTYDCNCKGKGWHFTYPGWWLLVRRVRYQDKAAQL